MTENFNDTIFGMYKEHLNSLTENMPETDLDLDYLTESKLLGSIMQDIRKDAINIAEKNGNKEYDFEEELAALKIDADDIEAGILEDYGGVSRGRAGAEAKSDENAEDGGYSGEAEKTAIFAKVPEASSNNESDGEEDVKVFAGKAAVAATMAGDTVIFDKNTVNNASPPREEQYNSDNSSAQNERYEEEPIATYDSDDFRQDDYAKAAGTGRGGETDDNEEYNSPLYDGGVDDEPEDGDEDEEDLRKVGFLGSLFGKKKNARKKYVSKNRDDDDDIDYELDDDDDNYDIDDDDL